MPVTTLTANMVVQFALSKSNGMFAPTKTALDGIEYNLANLNLIFDQVYVAELIIPTSTTTTLDLTSLMNLVNESINFTKLLFLFAIPSGTDLNVAPGGSNGLQIFGGSSRSVDVPENGALFWGGDPAGTGKTVDSTHKNLAFQNLGGGPDLSVDLIICGDG